MTQTILNNRYRIIRVLAEGGFGKTFLTEDSYLPSGKRFVIKQLKAITENPQTYQMVQERFQREAAILEDLGQSSDQIPKLYAYVEEHGLFYLVQEWIEGQTLSQKVQQQGLLSESAVQEILKSLLLVLDYVHSKNIVHRDIKPDNIILRDRDGKPVLIDFGAVRETMGTMIDSQGNSTSSVVIGTPGFMPSEQVAGRPVYSSDLYALGLTMIYLLTGKPPQELQTDHRTGAIVWRQYALNVSPSLTMVLDKAIQPYARDRYMTAREMLEALYGHAAVAPTVVSPQYAMASSSANGLSAPLPVPSAPQYSPVPSPSNGFYSESQGGSYYQSNPVNVSGSGTVGGGGTFNTSIPVPPEIQGWNWGAFLLSPIWCLTNQVWVGLISWIPYLGLPMPFILGAKGNVWAWRSRQWRSLQEFKAHQRAWAKAGAIVYSSLFGLFFLLVIFGAMVESPPEESQPGTSPTVTEESVTPTPTPKTEESSSKFQQVEIGSLETYTYNNQLFSIDVPQGWKRQDKSQSGEAIVLWLDSAENGLLGVNIFAEESQQTQKQLSEMLQRVLNSFFGSQPDFKLSEPVIQPDGSVRITWSYTVTVDNGIKGTFAGESFIEQRGNKISILTYALPKEQHSSLEQPINQILRSYKINPSAPLPQ